jgi:hypothetical protein
MSFDTAVGLGEILAGIATVLTLLFVAFEMRARRHQDRLTMLTTLDRAYNEINAQLASSEKLAALYRKGRESPDRLTPEEMVQFDAFVVQYINVHRSLFALLKEGALNSHHKQWFAADAKFMYRLPGFRKVFEEIEGLLDPAFVEYIRHASVR